MTMLSKNFRLSELLITNTGLNNQPDHPQREKLFYLCQFILQPIRDEFGKITISSGFRSVDVNKAVGGAANSQHTLGEAADIVPTAPIMLVYYWIISKLNYGQVILEDKAGKKWIHVSLPRLDKPNKEALIYENGRYRIYG